MISEELTEKQKDDLKNFVEIVYENKRLWFSKDGYGAFLPFSTPEYFGDIISLLNTIFINFPIIREEGDVNDDFKVKEMRWVLQIITDDAFIHGKRPGLAPENPEFIMVFKHADKIYEEISDSENLNDLNTQSLLNTLDEILEKLKVDDFDEETWYDD